MQVTLYFDDGTSSSSVLDLAPHEFRQLNSIVRMFRTNGAYNARAAIRVMEGDGRIAAYASVIDDITQDPFYIPAE